MANMSARSHSYNASHFLNQNMSRAQHGPVMNARVCRGLLFLNLFKKYNRNFKFPSIQEWVGFCLLSFKLVYIHDSTKLN